MSDRVAFRLRDVVLPVYLPTSLFSLAEGALIPLVPVLAVSLGASLGVAGLIGGLHMAGTLLGDLVSGSVVSRFGERRAMLLSAGFAAAGMAACGLAGSALWLAVGVFLIGLANAVFALARHAFLASMVPMTHRARALSALGGVFRGGFFVGPFIAAGLIGLAGDRSIAWLALAITAMTVVSLVVLPDVSDEVAAARQLPTASGAVVSSSSASASTHIFATLWAHRSIYLTVGLGSAVLMGLRSARNVVLPLWALSLGMGSAQTALLLSVVGGIDFLFSYSSGQVMDRFGRIWSAVPPLAAMALTFGVLALSGVLGASLAVFLGCAVAIGFANGFSSGVVLTFSADLAPRRNPAPFLGGFRLTTDLGAALLPLMVSAMTAVTGLAAAVAALSAVGWLGAGILLHWVPKYLPRGKPRLAKASPK